MTIRTANITLNDCLLHLKTMAEQSFAFTDEIPEVLKEDFNEFVTGKTLSISEGREITFDIEDYYKKIVYGKGIGYSIQWLL